MLNNEVTNLRMNNHVFVILHHANKRNRKAMNRNWGNQKTKPALKTKTGKINITNKQNTMRTN